MMKLIRVWLLAAWLAAAWPVTPALAQAAPEVVYVVQAGDTLSGIALRYNLNLIELALANGVINPNLIYVGQRLKVPHLMGDSPAAATQPAATPAPTATKRMHTVSSGETLYRIAAQYSTTVQALAAANNLADAGLIYVGQQLVISAEATSAAPPATPLRAPFTQ